MRIGVFDSGVGGLTVLEELLRRLPGHEFLYLGDTANVPYGTKSPEQIRRLSSDCARRQRDEGVDALVVACNTASSQALGEIRAVMGATPVLGVVEPGAEAAFARLQALLAAGGAPASAERPLARSGDAPYAPALAAGEVSASGPASRALVLATRATVHSGAYPAALRARGFSGEVVQQACPLLVPMIEEGWRDHPILRRTIEEYVSSHVAAGPPGVALLGCTHYPWVQAAIEAALPGWAVVNSAEAVADALVARLQAGPCAGAGKAAATRVRWIFTDPGAVPEFARVRLAALAGAEQRGE